MQLRELLDISENDVIFMPNEIFTDLRQAIGKPAPHIAFSYTYYYFINYLYRFCKYRIHQDIEFNRTDIMESLGYSKTYSLLDYITKKNGVLDKIGYTKQTNDYPIRCELDEQGDPIFTLISEYNHKSEMSQVGFKTDMKLKIKFPIKAFYRTVDDYKEGHLNGTFYDYKEESGSHPISASTFLEMMENKDLGVMGFYIFGFLKLRNKMVKNHQNGYSASLERLSASTGFPTPTIARYCKRLELEGFIKIVNQGFKKPNLYITIEKQFQLGK